MKCPLCSSFQEETWLLLPTGERYRLCRDCKLIWLEAELRPSREKEEMRYREHNNSLEDPRYLAYLRRTALSVADRLNLGAKGLDFGCGPVEGMKAILSPLGFSVESYDPIFFPRPELLKNSYDFILCSEVAEHFFSPGEEFARLCELLREGGFLAVSSRLAVSKEQFAQWNYRRDPTHVVFYQRETVEWIARKFDLRLLELNDPLWLLQKSSSGGRNLL